MNIDKFERANIIIKSLIPSVNELINISSKSNEFSLLDSLHSLTEYDEEFKNKFN